MGSNAAFDTFQVTLAAAGVAQRVQKPGTTPGTGNPPANALVVKALKENAGFIYVSGSEANATSGKGYELAAGESISADLLGAGGLWFNGTKTGDKICVASVGP